MKFEALARDFGLWISFHITKQNAVETSFCGACRATFSGGPGFIIQGMNGVGAVAGDGFPCLICCIPINDCSAS